MSYRLIDSNAIAIKYPEVNEMPCVFANLPDGLNGQFIDAQPMRKKGKWVYGEDEYGIDGYHCDKCGFFLPWDYAHTFINYIEDYNFCPCCGADMREGGEGDRT